MIINATISTELPMSQNNELHGAELFLRNQELLRREEDERSFHLLPGGSLKSRISYSARPEIFAFHRTLISISLFAEVRH